MEAFSENFAIRDDCHAHNMIFTIGKCPQFLPREQIPQLNGVRFAIGAMATL